MNSDLIEVRYELRREVIDVIDAIVQATPGSSRTSILRKVAAEFAAQEMHKARLVLRVAGSNGTELAD